ncbi:hypothetical protein [Alkalicoccus chagannorensis]|uniref:hypothetical protein n=1 Tax=Alkalicoccus chagannorensis TaxID=427072 RepID=UPI0012EC05FD|nr:hypothetical protein [Alkalicoccus chagannorensis]
MKVDTSLQYVMEIMPNLLFMESDALKKHLSWAPAMQGKKELKTSHAKHAVRPLAKRIL